MHEQSYGEAQAKTKFTSRYTSRACDAGLLHFRRLRCIEILYIEGTSGPWAYPSSRQRENTSRTDPLCPIAHAACPARQRRMVQFIGSLTLEPAGYHGRAHLQRRLYLVPSMYNISMLRCRREERGAAAWSYIYIYIYICGDIPLSREFCIRSTRAQSTIDPLRPTKVHSLRRGRI